MKWAFNFASDIGISVASQYVGISEPVLADLNQDGTPEIIVATYGYPDKTVANQYLFILSSIDGSKLYRISTSDNTTNPNSNFDGNGNGAMGAPTVADINGDGQLEILLHTFDARLLIWTVPGSARNCLVWPTGRGGYLRKGQNDVY